MNSSDPHLASLPSCKMKVATPTSRCWFLLHWLWLDSVLCGYAPPTKYLIVSNAREGTIGYAKLRRDGKAEEVQTLVDKDLIHPQGIAVDQKRQLLLVADSELKKVVSYGLTVGVDGSLSVDEQTPVAENVDTRWVAVDGPGNVYMTDELPGTVLRVGAKQVLDGDTTPRPVFDKSGGGSSISAPGGVAADNFNVFWVNKAEGKTVGTVMKALGAPPAKASTLPLQPTLLAKNLPKAYGVCLAQDRLYFTAPERDVHAVGAVGGEVTTVASKLSTPRGCVWDGESTVYVADRSANAVFAVAGPGGAALEEGVAKKVIDFPGAFGVAVFSSAPTGAMTSWMCVLFLVMAAASANERPA